MNTSAKGARYERKSMAIFEALGYRCHRVAASKGEWDFVGVGADFIVLVQVKFGDWPGRAEMAALRAYEAPFNAVKVVHRWRHRVEMPDVREL